MRYFRFLFFLLIISFQLRGQNVTLSGKALDYRGKTIVFYTIPDPLLKQKQILGSSVVNENGTFKLSFAISETSEIYSDLEEYCGTIVVVPGQKYVVTLPPFSLRTADEAHSSFFKPALYWLGLPETDKSDLNFMVRAFITNLTKEKVKNTAQIYQNGSKDIVSQIITKLEKQFPDGNFSYFNALKLYSYAELEYAVYRLAPDVVIMKYFANKPVAIQNPAYQSVFELIFTDFLNRQSQDHRYSNIGKLVNSGDFIGLVDFFVKKGYQREFAELVVLKGLYDGYYSVGYVKSEVVKAIESCKISTQSTLIKNLAQQIGGRLNLLSVGKMAPAFKLANSKNEVVSLDKYKGKFVYLSFVNTRSADNRMELDSLVTVERQLKQALTVVTVAVDEDFNKAVKLWKDKGYKWELLDGSKQSQLISNYNTNITPSFYLIAPDKRLLLSPALAPSHDFQPAFLRLLRDYGSKQRKSPLEPARF